MLSLPGRFARGSFAAVLAFIEEWQPPIAPRRIMADAVDALNEFEELHETLPEPSSARFGSTWCATHHTTISTCYQEHQCDVLPDSEAVTTSAGECAWCNLHGEWCAGEKCWYQLRLAESPQASPNPHGDLPSVPMSADGSAAEVSAAPPAPSAAPSTSAGAQHTPK